MPYGYEEYRLSKGISPNTTYVEVRLIKSLLAFVNHKYKRSVEPREILPRDIKEFLLEQKAQGLKDSTILRKIGTIANWYDYMWKIGKIEIDFMTKFSFPEKLERNVEVINLNYKYLLTKKNEILDSTSLLLYAKMLYILYLRGFRVRDIVRIQLVHIEDKGDSIILQIPKNNGCTQKAVFSDKEIPIILECIERSIFRGTEYLLSSKKGNKYVPLQLGSLKDYLNSIKEIIGFSFRSEQVRLAYAHYLYTYENKRVEDLQEILGMPISSASITLKEALERVKQVEYNN
ncbi:hypothetical protein B14911_10527 [Bacillus sp. NRRL B-14911]|uniref:site-specific integrase n=1 Tax=Bacillus sp. NRRL B-14911 TaxID=313627 RepID=UPI00006B598C|nr:site-specific integrase [Bacillus sp. NRRL B-14911]EAR66163.1 hypothetical protein B14911_10527 [Bacillus sp. NRRL B-14911]